MKIETFTPLRFIILVCIAVSVIIPLYFIGYSLVNHINLSLRDIFYNVTFSFSISASISIANYYTILFLDRKLTWNRNKMKRFFIEFSLTNLIASCIITAVVISVNYLFYYQKDNKSLIQNIYFNITIAIIVNTVVVAIFEGQSLIRKWLHSLIEMEQLRREHAESKYAVLKNQVIPHFLFNSLNSLNSLIRISPEKAIEFVDKFSKIYRYVLDVSDKMVVELYQEVDFLQAYYFLQRIRFGDNLIINITIDAKKMNDFILPLSIQMLIENAIKHNEISKDNPLNISITVEGEYLVISNNLQRKQVFEHSNGISLTNLKERYKHFTDIEPLFYYTDNCYIAKIPIIHEND
jgi:sensor histidine kinase YesM